MVHAISITFDSNDVSDGRPCELIRIGFHFVVFFFSSVLEQGFQRVYEDMADIVLDVPLAYIMLDRFVERCSRAGFLTDKTIKNMPSR